MPQCPQCGTALKDDYGMASCPSCGLIVFIDMDGVAHRGAEPETDTSASEASELNFVAMPSSFNEGSESSENFFGGDEQPIEPIQPMEFSADPLPSPVGVDVGVEAVMPEPVIDAVSATGGEFSMDNLLGYGEPTDQTPEASSGLGPAGDPLGLAGYANSELSQAKDGPFVFRVLISGIDTKEIRDSIREAIEDSRFGWDPAQLMSRISKGDLTIDNVSPVKAAILINRIKRLPLRIRWEQYAITQMDNV